MKGPGQLSGKVPIAEGMTVKDWLAIVVTSGSAVEWSAPTCRVEVEEPVAALEMQRWIEIAKMSLCL